MEPELPQDMNPVLLRESDNEPDEDETPEPEEVISIPICPNCKMKKWSLISITSKINLFQMDLRCDTCGEVIWLKQHLSQLESKISTPSIQRSYLG